MKTILNTLLTTTLFFAGFAAQAGTTCMGETYSGKVITLDMSTVGSMGAYSAFSLKVTDKTGQVLLSKISDARPAQFASTVRGKKALVVFSTIADNFDVMLNYLGTDFSEVQWKKNLELEEILKSKSRKKEAGNSLIIYSYVPGLANIELTDIVCSLDHDA